MAVTVKLIGPVRWEEDDDGKWSWGFQTNWDRCWESQWDASFTKKKKRASKTVPMRAPGRVTKGGRTTNEAPGTAHWIYAGKLYQANDDGLEPGDVLALLNEAANKRRLQLEKAHALQAMSEEMAPKAKRAPIPSDVKIVVWKRDGGRCVECGAQEDLEFDHIIPVAMGGANTMRNLQLLCGPCNRRKGATLG